MATLHVAHFLEMARPPNFSSCKMCQHFMPRTPMNQYFLHEKSGGRVISNKTNIPWSPSSPDANPLDFLFWGHSMNHVYRMKPATMEDLKRVVEEFAESMDSNLIKKVCASTRSRFEKMRDVQGGHSEHLK